MFLILFLFIATAVDLDNNLQICGELSNSSNFRVLNDKFKIQFDGYRGMFDQSLSNSKDLADMLRSLPGVVVQKNLSMQGMADLYRIKPEFLKHHESIELLRPSPNGSLYMDDYLSDFLQDRDRSQLYYCDPELQHISICHQILSFSYQSNVFDLQS